MGRNVDGSACGHTDRRRECAVGHDLGSGDVEPRPVINVAVGHHGVSVFRRALDLPAVRASGAHGEVGAGDGDVDTLLSASTSVVGVGVGLDAGQGKVGGRGIKEIRHCETYVLKMMPMLPTTGGAEKLAFGALICVSAWSDCGVMLL